MIMREEVEQTEQHRGRLLHAQESPKRPFPVVLEDGFEVWRIAGYSFFGDDVLADVVAFGRAVPEEKTVLESWMSY